MARRLLVVDDEVVTLLAFQMLFGSSEIVVDTAETLTQAMALIDTASYDAAIVDLSLTGSSGEEGLTILQYMKLHQPGTTVIMVTGCGNDESRARAMRLGADYYFEKPVPPSVLRKALNHYGGACGRVNTTPVAAAAEAT